MEKQLVPHGEFRQAALYVPLQPLEQGVVVVAEKVRDNDQHVLKAVELLHQRVAVVGGDGRIGRQFFEFLDG